MRKISTKILLVLLIVCIISIVPISVIGLNSILRSSKEQAKDFGEKSAYYNAQIIKTWADEKSKLLINIREEIIKLDSEDKILQSLLSFSEINEDFISLFIGFEDNQMIDAYGWRPPSDYRPTERPWFKKASELSYTATTSVYEDKNKNRNVIALATGISVLDKRGVLAANVYADYLDEIVCGIKYGKDGFVFLLDEDSQIITGSKSNLDFALFESLMNRMVELKIDHTVDGTYEIKNGDETYITSIAKIEGYDWSLFLIAPINDFMSAARQMVSQFIYISFAVILLVFLLDLYLSRTISAPIENLIQSISKIAKGNFEDVVHIEGKDEVATLGLEVDKMRVNLKRIFDASKYESKMLSMNTKNLETHIADTYKGTYNFMSLLSHDIKTPVTLIKGYSQALNIGLGSEEKQKEYIERIGYRADQIEKIANDILDDTLDVESMSVKPLPLDIQDYINMAIYNSEHYVKNQKRVFVSLIDRASFGSDVCVQVDVIKIQRVLNNILSNAVKFSQEGTKIELIIEKRGKFLLTAFKDYGEGVERENMDKVFNMFYKSNEDKKGYGLGLYINKAIVKGHEGNMYFDSEYGDWTISGFELQLCSGEECIKDI